MSLIKRYGDAAQLRRAVEKCQAKQIEKKVYKKSRRSLWTDCSRLYTGNFFSQDGTVIENKRN